LFPPCFLECEVNMTEKPKVINSDDQWKAYTAELLEILIEEIRGLRQDLSGKKPEEKETFWKRGKTNG
jgi:hypothetical protein